MKSISRELVSASAIPIILSLLENEDSYGYEILQLVKEYTDGKVVWQEAIIYPLLKKMEKDGLVKSYWKTSEQEHPRKYYTILSNGKNQLEYNKQEWLKIYGIFQGLWKSTSR